MIDANYKMGHVTLITPIRGSRLFQDSHLIYSTCIQNLATFASAILEIWLRTSKLKMEIWSTCVQNLTTLASANPVISLGPQNLQVAQLLLTNPRYALNHGKQQNFITVTCTVYVAITTPLLWMICHHVARIDIAYLCTDFDVFRFSRSCDMIGAPKIFNGSHDLTTPLSGTVCRP